MVYRLSSVTVPNLPFAVLISTYRRAVCAAAVATLLAGCGADASKTTRSPRHPAVKVRVLNVSRRLANESAPTILGGSAQQNDIVRAILVGLANTPITAVSFGTPPPAMAEAEPAVITPTAWLYFTIATGGDQVRQFEGEWEADLVAGNYRDRAGALGVPQIRGYSFSYILPDGVVMPGPAAALPPSVDTPIDIGDAAHLTSLIQERLTDAETEAGVISDASISYVQPHGLAPVVKVVARDPGHAARYFMGHGLFDGMEGGCLELRDDQGALVLATAGTARLRNGSAMGPDVRPPSDPAVGSG